MRGRTERGIRHAASRSRLKAVPWSPFDDSPALLLHAGSSNLRTSARGDVHVLIFPALWTVRYRSSPAEGFLIVSVIQVSSMPG